MDAEIITIRWGGRDYQGRYAVNDGRVRVSSPFGYADGAVGSDAKGAAERLLARIVEVHARGAGEGGPAPQNK